MPADPRDSSDSLVARLRTSRAGHLTEAVETVALDLFAEHGFAAVTVEQIATGAGISVRTFYRYFPTKEDVLQVQIDRRAGNVAAALAARPAGEAPLRSLRLGLAVAVAREDPGLTRRWTGIVAENPEVVRAVLGGIILKTQHNIGAFFASRLDVPSGSLVPTTLAAAATGVLQAAHTQWFLTGGDLADHVSQGVAALEEGLRSGPDSWTSGALD